MVLASPVDAWSKHDQPTSNPARCHAFLDPPAQMYGLLPCLPVTRAHCRLSGPRSPAAAASAQLDIEHREHHLHRRGFDFPYYPNQFRSSAL